jgi:hypothetical protein
MSLSTHRAVWLFILIWFAVWSGIFVVSAVAILGWLIAQSAEWIVAIAMAVTGQ